MSTKKTKPRKRKYTIVAWNNRRMVVRHFTAHSFIEVEGACDDIRDELRMRITDPRWQILDGHVELEAR